MTNMDWTEEELRSTLERNLLENTLLKPQKSQQAILLSVWCVTSNVGHMMTNMNAILEETYFLIERNILENT